MKRILLIVLRVTCYAALAVVAAGIGTMIALSASGVCPVFNEGSISCNSEAATGLARFSMTVMLLTAFTGVPALLALGGLVFLVRDCARLFGRVRPATLALYALALIVLAGIVAGVIGAMNG